MRDFDIIDFDEPRGAGRRGRSENRDGGGREGGSGRRRGIIVLIIIIILAALYIAAAVYFSNHFMLKTRVNGINASFLTADQVEEKLQKRLSSYTLTLEERGGKAEQISGKDLNIQGDFGTKVSDALKEQGAFAWIARSWSDKEVEVDEVATYDSERLDSLIAGLECMDENYMKESRNATVSSEPTDGKFTIVEEVYGTVIKEDVLRQAVAEAVDSLSDTLNLSEAGCYENPKYTKDSQEVIDACDQINTMTKAHITYDMLDIDPVEIDASTIRSWITISKKMKVKMNEEKITEFVEEFAKKYNTSYTPRKFVTADGQTITLPGGYYGWRLSKDTEIAALTEEIREGKTVTREPNWYRRAVSHTEKEYGDTYAEVDISQQEMWFFQDGKVKLNTSVVTGDVTKGRGTPQGIFAVMYKESDATLRGEDYSSPVDYFMPFETNVGFHDASWRDEFGGSIYKGNGSHGCVNMPPSQAKALFSLIQKDMPVIVHE